MLTFWALPGQARTRTGGSYAVKVDLGQRRRCRFHGGKSTVPKLAEGRAWIAKAPRRRWAATRKVEDVVAAPGSRRPLHETPAHENIAAAVAGIPTASAPDWIERSALHEERFFDAGDDMMDSNYNPYG